MSIRAVDLAALIIDLSGSKPPTVQELHLLTSVANWEVAAALGRRTPLAGDRIAAAPCGPVVVDLIGRFREVSDTLTLSAGDSSKCGPEITTELGRWLKANRDYDELRDRTNAKDSPWDLARKRRSVSDVDEPTICHELAVLAATHRLLHAAGR